MNEKRILTIQVSKITFPGDIQPTYGVFIERDGKHLTKAVKIAESDINKLPENKLINMLVVNMLEELE